MSRLADEVMARARIEWPGLKQLPDGEYRFHPTVRKGGSTDLLIDLIGKIIDEELDKTNGVR